MIEIKHSTSKSGIRSLGLLKGKGNADTVMIGERAFEPGTLVFVGFVAPVPADLSPGPKTWHGVLRFREAETAHTQRAPMAHLLVSTPKPKDVPVKRKAVDDV